MTTKEQHLPNLHAVLDTNGQPTTPWLFRGGQPTAEGFDLLKSQYGVETVICLRRDSSRWEEQYLENSGLKFVSLHLPLKLRKLSADDFRQRVSVFLQAVTDGPRNVYVHCLEGRDRTGLMIALYRIYMQAWPLDEAFSEMQACGYSGFAHHVILSSFKDKLYDWSNPAMRATVAIK